MKANTFCGGRTIVLNAVKDISKYENVIGEKILSPDQSQKIEQAKFKK